MCGCEESSMGCTHTPELFQRVADLQRHLGMLGSGDKAVMMKVMTAQLMGMGDTPGPNTGISPCSWDLLAPSGTSVPCPGKGRLRHIPIQPACCGPGLFGTHPGLCISGLESFGGDVCTARGVAERGFGALLHGCGQPREV